MSTLTEDIQRFLALHHRVHELTPEERAQYEALRQRVSAALQTTPVPATRVAK